MKAPSATARRVSRPGRKGSENNGPSADLRVRRQEILGVASKIFAQKGFEATSIREIANAAGILSGSLYHHFNTKEEMLHEISREYIFLLLHEYERIAKSISDPREALKAMITFALRNLTEHSEIHAIIFNDRKFFQRQQGFEYVREAWQGIYYVWYGVIQEGVKTGAFRANMNISLTLSMMLETISATVNWFDPMGRHTIDDVIEAQIKLLFRGIEA
jgi:AcrR family transcriptional regulator